GGTHKDRQRTYYEFTLQNLFKRYFFSILGIGIQASMVVILDGNQCHVFTCYTANRLSSRLTRVEHRDVTVHEQTSVRSLLAASSKPLFYLCQLRNIHSSVKCA